MNDNLILVKYFSLRFYHKLKYPISKLRRLMVNESFLDCAGESLTDILKGDTTRDIPTIPTIPTVES